MELIVRRRHGIEFKADLTNISMSQLAIIRLAVFNYQEFVKNKHDEPQDYKEKTEEVYDVIMQFK